LPFGQLAKPSDLTLTHESVPFEARDDQHGILSEAEVQVLFVAEALETSGGAVSTQGLLGACKVQFHGALRPLVELRALLPQEMEDGASGGLVLGGPTAARASATAWAFTNVPARMAGALRAASTSLLPFVVLRTTVAPLLSPAAPISVGELPKSNP
jgi:hypothetical protein